MKACSDWKKFAIFKIKKNNFFKKICISEVANRGDFAAVGTENGWIIKTSTDKRVVSEFHYSLRITATWICIKHKDRNAVIIQHFLKEIIKNFNCKFIFLHSLTPR